MNAIIIDNESDAIEYLQGIVELFCPEVKIIASADGVVNGIKAINTHQPDFIFLDVEMDDGTGFDLVNAIADTALKVIFTTAFDKYAIQAIKLSAVDFLLKPVDPEELQTSIERIKAATSKEEQLLKLKALQNNVLTNNEQKIVLKDRENIYVVEVEDIIYCEGEGSYTTFHLVEDEHIMISKNLKSFESVLPADSFFRTHTSYLVNLSKIKRIAKGISDVVVMKNGKEIPIAVRRKADLINKLI